MELKFIAYILLGIGLLGMFVVTPPVLKAVPQLSSINLKFIIVPAVIMFFVGIIFLLSGGSSGKKMKNPYSHTTKMGAEVPIFHGGEIVGYRIRTKK